MDASAFQTVKLAVVGATGLSKDALHVYVGLAAYLLASLLWRKRLGFPLPLVIVVLFACSGEALDMRDDLRSLGHWRWRASLHDVINTSFWPLLLSGLVRWTSIFASSK